MKLLREMDERDPARLGVFLAASKQRDWAWAEGAVTKVRRMKAGHGWIWGITPKGYEALEA